MITKKILIPVVALVVAGGVVFSARQVIHAQTTGDKLTTLVQMIAKKFNLDQTQVQSVVDEFHTDQRKNMQSMMEQRTEKSLTTLVNQGKITETQKQSILTELSVLKAKYNQDSFETMTPDERRKKLEDMHTELNNWAKSQGLDETYLRLGMGGMKGGMHGMRGNWKNISPTPTPAS